VRGVLPRHVRITKLKKGDWKNGQRNRRSAICHSHRNRVGIGRWPYDRRNHFLRQIGRKRKMSTRLGIPEQRDSRRSPHLKETVVVLLTGVILIIGVCWLIVVGIVVIVIVAPILFPWHITKWAWRKLYMTLHPEALPFDSNDNWLSRIFSPAEDDDDEEGGICLVVSSETCEHDYTDAKYEHELITKKNRLRRIVFATCKKCKHRVYFPGIEPDEDEDY